MNKFTPPWMQAQLTKTSTSVWYQIKNELKKLSIQTEIDQSCCTSHFPIQEMLWLNHILCEEPADFWICRWLCFMRDTMLTHSASSHSLVENIRWVGCAYQEYKIINTQKCKYKNTPTFFFRSTTWHNWTSQMFGTTQCSWPCLLTNRCLGCRMPENTLQ